MKFAAIRSRSGWLREQGPLRPPRGTENCKACQSLPKLAGSLFTCLKN